jgi:hypothetical protein
MSYRSEQGNPFAQSGQEKAPNIAQKAMNEISPVIEAIVARADHKKGDAIFRTAVVAAVGLATHTKLHHMYGNHPLWPHFDVRWYMSNLPGQPGHDFRIETEKVVFDFAGDIHKMMGQPFEVLYQYVHRKSEEALPHVKRLIGA